MLSTQIQKVIYPANLRIRGFRRKPDRKIRHLDGCTIKLILVGLIACVVVILLVVGGVMLLHLHNTNKPQNEVPISEMETEEDDVVFSGDFSVDW